MIKTIQELKTLIIWCKEHKIKKLELGDVKFEISELDFLPENLSNPTMSTNLGDYNTDTLSDTVPDKSITEDEDLFWSSNS